MQDLDRFTLHARNVLCVAQTEAESLQRRRTSCLHLLEGMLTAEGSVAQAALGDFGLTSQDLAEELLTSGSRRASGEDTEFSAELAWVVAAACEWIPSPKPVGTGDLLAALAERPGRAAKVFAEFNIDAERVRAKLAQLAEEGIDSELESRAIETIAEEMGVKLADLQQTGGRMPTITVGQLIARLELLDPDLPVLVLHSLGDGSYPVFVEGAEELCHEELPTVGLAEYADLKLEGIPAAVHISLSRE